MVTRILLLTSVVVFAGVGLVMLYRHGVAVGQAEVQARWSQQREKDLEELGRMSQRSREVEQGLQRHIEQMRVKHAQQMASLQHRYAIAVDIVRKRAERPADYVPATPEAAGAEPAAACGADRLFRDDGEFLAGLAQDADEISAALTECRSAYAEAQDAINKLSAERTTE